MRFALLPSTQWGNPVLGGGSEALYMQDIAKRMSSMFPGHEVKIFVGSQSDKNVDGAKDAAAWNPDACLCIHADGGYFKKSLNGFLMCYQDDRGLDFAKYIANLYALGMQMGLRDYQKRVWPKRVATIRYPTEAGIPTCLIETTWMDRDPDATLLRSETWRQKAAVALANGIKTYLKIKEIKPKGDDEMQSWQYDNVTKVSKIDCYKDRANYYVTTKGTSPVVTFEFEGHKPLGGGGTTEPQDVSGIQDHNIQDLLKQDRLKSIKGSYALTVTSANPITISIREVPK